MFFSSKWHEIPFLKPCKCELSISAITIGVNAPIINNNIENKLKTTFNLVVFFVILASSKTNNEAKYY